MPGTGSLLTGACQIELIFPMPKRVLPQHRSLTDGAASWLTSGAGLCLMAAIALEWGAVRFHLATAESVIERWCSRDAPDVASFALDCVQLGRGLSCILLCIGAAAMVRVFRWSFFSVYGGALLGCGLRTGLWYVPLVNRLFQLPRNIAEAATYVRYENVANALFVACVCLAHAFIIRSDLISGRLTLRFRLRTILFIVLAVGVCLAPIGWVVRTYGILVEKDRVKMEEKKLLRQQRHRRQAARAVAPPGLDRTWQAPCC